VALDFQFADADVEQYRHLLLAGYAVVR